MTGQLELDLQRGIKMLAVYRSIWFGHWIQRRARNRPRGPVRHTLDQVEDFVLYRWQRRFGFGWTPGDC